MSLSLSNFFLHCSAVNSTFACTEFLIVLALKQIIFMSKHYERERHFSPTGHQTVKSILSQPRYNSLESNRWRWSFCNFLPGCLEGFVSFCCLDKECVFSENSPQTLLLLQKMQWRLSRNLRCWIIRGSFLSRITEPYRIYTIEHKTPMKWTWNRIWLVSGCPDLQFSKENINTLHTKKIGTVQCPTYFSISECRYDISESGKRSVDVFRFIEKSAFRSSLTNLEINRINKIINK